MCFLLYFCAPLHGYGKLSFISLLWTRLLYNKSLCSTSDCFYYILGFRLYVYMLKYALQIQIFKHLVDEYYVIRNSLFFVTHLSFIHFLIYSVKFRWMPVMPQVLCLYIETTPAIKADIPSWSFQPRGWWILNNYMFNYLIIVINAMRGKIQDFMSMGTPSSLEVQRWLPWESVSFMKVRVYDIKIIRVNAHRHANTCTLTVST